MARIYIFLLPASRSKNISINCLLAGGAFPTLLALITIFFTSSLALSSSKGWAGLLSALMLTGIILAGVVATFLVSRLLSATVLKGVPSSFTLELPPYRRPQIGRVLIRSALDRTLFVLGRAVSVAAPAGLIIWLMANINVGGGSLLALCSNFLDPFGRFFGMDGVIILAFILGFPANEIVLPIIIMTYQAAGSLMDFSSLTELGQLLTANGWTAATALCVMTFSLFHFPCSTALLSIKKETGSWGWTALAALLPTALGLILTKFISLLASLPGLFLG